MPKINDSLNNNRLFIKENSKDASGVSNRKINKSNIDTSINSFQIEHGRREGNKFILEEITNYILKNLESFYDKTIIVTFERPVTTNEIKMDNCILTN